MLHWQLRSADASYQLQLACYLPGQWLRYLSLAVHGKLIISYVCVYIADAALADRYKHHYILSVCLLSAKYVSRFTPYSALAS